MIHVVVNEATISFDSPAAYRKLIELGPHGLMWEGIGKALQLLLRCRADKLEGIAELEIDPTRAELFFPQDACVDFRMEGQRRWTRTGLRMSDWDASDAVQARMLPYRI